MSDARERVETYRGRAIYRQTENGREVYYYESALVVCHSGSSLGGARVDIDRSIARQEDRAAARRAVRVTAEPQSGDHFSDVTRWAGLLTDTLAGLSGFESVSGRPLLAQVAAVLAVDRETRTHYDPLLGAPGSSGACVLSVRFHDGQTGRVRVETYGSPDGTGIIATAL